MTCGRGEAESGKRQKRLRLSDAKAADRISAIARVTWRGAQAFQTQLINLTQQRDGAEIDFRDFSCSSSGLNASTEVTPVKICRPNVADGLRVALPWYNLRQMCEAEPICKPITLCVYNTHAWGAASGNTVFKWRGVYLKSGRVSVWATVYFSPAICMPVCLHRTPRVYCTIFTQVGPTVTVCVCARVHVCVCVFFFSFFFSLAWGSSSCVKVSCSKCLNSQKRKKRGE